MSYAIADVIYGVTGDDLLEALQKADLESKDVDDFLSDLGFEDLKDGDEPVTAEDVYKAILECDLLDSAYRGNGPEPVWLGVEIDGFDEACTYQKASEINFVPTDAQKQEYLDNLKQWPKTIVDALPDPYIFIAWGSS